MHVLAVKVYQIDPEVRLLYIHSSIIASFLEYIQRCRYSKY
jgi:hypothetical protein